MKPTQKEFNAYVAVQRSGQTNMFDREAVQALISRISDEFLDKEKITYIMSNYNDLMQEYGESEDE